MREDVMENQNARCSGQALGLAFLSGAIAGAVVGILLAPKSGQETRRALKGYAKKAEEEVIEKATEARAILDEAIERGKYVMAEKRVELEAAVKAGQEAVKETIAKCCG
jgi:gas vesicle protein